MMRTYHTPEETPVSPVSFAGSSEAPQQSAEVGAGGLLGSPRPETPVSPVDERSHIDRARDFFDRMKAAETEEQKKRSKLSASVFSIMQYEQHTDTGEIMVTQEQIDSGVAMASIKKFAYAWHDLDRFTEDEAARQQELGRSVSAGDVKPRHVHIVLSCDHDYSIRQISDWFMIPTARVQVPRELAEKEGRNPHAGRGAREKAFFDFAQYLTHEGRKQSNKHQYTRDVVVANFNFGQALDDHMSGRGPAGRSGSQRKVEELMLAVMHGQMSLREVRRDHPVEYGKNIDSFKKWRGDFLLSQEPPRLRLNQYIGGKLGEELLGRTGKSTLGRLMARALYPELDAAECYHEATDKRVPLQNYAGQPVIIWDDYSPVDLMEALGGRTGVWQVFADRPGATDANIKHGSVRLVHEVNIITRVTPYQEYFDALAGHYVDRFGKEHFPEAPEQAWGRFAFASEVTRDSFSFLVNQSFVTDTPEYREFKKMAIVRASMKAIGQHLDSIRSDEEREAAMHQVGDALLGTMLDSHKALRPSGTKTKDEALAALLPTLEVLTGDALEQYEAQHALEAEAALEAEKIAKRAAQEAAAAKTAALFETSALPEDDIVVTHHSNGLVTTKTRDFVVTG